MLHAFIISSSCVLKLGHQTVLCALRLHLAMPWCAERIHSRISKCKFEGMPSMVPLRSRPCCTFKSLYSANKDALAQGYMLGALTTFVGSKPWPVGGLRPMQVKGEFLAAISPLPRVSPWSSLRKPTWMTRGLLLPWHFPSRYMENLSHAQVGASASFSIWAYITLVEVMDLEANATGLISPSSCLCISTVPIPYDDASAKTSVSFCGSYSWKTTSDLMIDLMSSKDLCWSGPYVHVLVVTSNSWRGFVLCARCGTNLLR